MAPKDDRLYAKLTLDFSDSPKIAPLSDAAFRQYIEAILWSRRLLTDGIIPAAMVRKLFTTDALAELMTNDPVSPSISDRGDGNHEIHDFLDHQTSRAEIALMREQKREAGRKGGRARADIQQNASSGLAGAKQVLDVRYTENGKQNPSRIKPERETETETLKDEVRVQNKPALEYSEEFDQWWEKYPRHQGKVEAARAFKSARKTTDLKTLLDGAQAYTLLQIGVEKTLIKMPAGWLNDKRWNDDQIAAHVPDKRISKDARAFSLIEQGRAMDNRQLASVPHHPTDAEYRSSMCSEPGHEEYPLASGCEACKRRVGLAVGVSF